jgi:multidrug efflux pump subunit AcrB
MAIGPVILISGVGLLLLSMTNRLGRVIDRSRLLAESLRKVTEDGRPRITAQLKVLARRARLVRLAIILATLSMLLAAVLVIVLFMAAVFRLEVAVLVITIFVGCMASLFASLIVFIMDIDLSLAALKLEMAPD